MVPSEIELRPGTGLLLLEPTGDVIAPIVGTVKSLVEGVAAEVETERAAPEL